MILFVQTFDFDGNVWNVYAQRNRLSFAVSLSGGKGKRDIKENLDEFGFLTFTATPHGIMNRYTTKAKLGYVCRVNTATKETRYGVATRFNGMKDSHVCFVECYNSAKAMEIDNFFNRSGYLRDQEELDCYLHLLEF